MLASASGSAFVEWLAFLDQKTIGPERADMQTALLCSVLAQMRTDKPVDPSTYLLYAPPAPKIKPGISMAGKKLATTPAQMRALAMANMRHFKRPDNK